MNSQPVPARRFLSVALALSPVALVSSLLFAQNGGVKFEKQRITDKFYAEGAAVGDFNKDGKQDIAYGPFWYAGPDFAEAKEIYEPVAFDPSAYSKNFLSWGHDVSGDGWDDYVVGGFPGEESWWFENPAGKEGGWQRHVIIAVTDNESPGFADITGDGSPELICSRDGYFLYAQPDPADPRKPWIEHRISEQVAGGKFTHGLGIGDVDGDGRMDLLEKGNWWKQPESLDGDPVWQRYIFQFTGAGGSQMFAYDFDGDGDNDILTSLAAHGYGLAWFEQTDDGTGKKGWERHLIMGESPDDKPFGVSFSQTHSVDLIDIDGDGVKDIVTGKRYWAHGGHDPGGNDPAVLYWFRTVRGGGKSGEATFAANEIDDDSGVGTQVLAADVTGDGKPDIIVGNKKGAFVHRQVAAE
jgi:hypothetical protein